jgi:hypothetical protein
MVGSVCAASLIGVHWGLAGGLRTDLTIVTSYSLLALRPAIRSRYCLSPSQVDAIL